jgi:hypothetical protein
VHMDKPKNCATCGVEFSKPYHVSRPSWEKRRYCSRVCFGKDYSRRLDSQMRKPRICEACGNDYLPSSFGAKFCSIECAKNRFVWKQGPNSPAWKGGRHCHAGYVRVYVPHDHKFAEMRGKHRYVMEHRLVMAEHVGRPLERRETVHHVNGDTMDNRLENLQLRSGRHGKGSAFVCIDCGSHNIEAVEIRSVA